MSLKLICTGQVLYKIKIPAKGGGFTVQTIFHSNTACINYALISVLTFGFKKKREKWLSGGNCSTEKPLVRDTQAVAEFLEDKSNHLE